MKSTRMMLACLSLGAATVAAQTLSISPPDPRPTDTITIVYRPAAAAWCPEIAPGGLRLDTQGPGDVVAIDVTLQPAADCAAGTQGRVTLGRLPTGSYEVRVFEAHDSAASRLGILTAFAPLTVQPHRGSPAAPSGPRDDYTGQWTTNLQGEGVTISQQGDRMFLAFLTYGDAGGATWYVVPDARHEVDASGAGRFEGALYAAFGTPATPGTIGSFLGVAQLGRAVLREVGTDEATLQLGFAGGSFPVARTITRMRF